MRFTCTIVIEVSRTDGRPVRKVGSAIAAQLVDVLRTHCRDECIDVRDVDHHVEIVGTMVIESVALNERLGPIERPAPVEAAPTTKPRHRRLLKKGNTP